MCSSSTTKFTSYRGYNIGIRLVDEFLAKSQLGRCRGLRETADIVAQVIKPM